MTTEPPTAEESIANARTRSAAFLAALDPALADREDQVASMLARENSSAKSKLGKVLRIVDELAEAAKPYIACGKGCSACCRMNVSITSLEAERLAAASGRALARLDRPAKHALEKFSGVPCPFLVNDACSVYEERPFACRAHMSFDTSSHWCQPERSMSIAIEMVKFSGVGEAYGAIARATRIGGFADIRDFFPS